MTPMRMNMAFKNGAQQAANHTYEAGEKVTVWRKIRQ